MKSIRIGLRIHQSVMALINGQAGAAFKVQQTITGTIMKPYMITNTNLGEERFSFLLNALP